MAPAPWIALVVASAAAAAIVAVVLARKHRRNPAAWATFTVAVGLTIALIERFAWTRQAGDAATPAGFDMQSLLPLFAMLGAAFLMTLLPPRQ